VQSSVEQACYTKHNLSQQENIGWCDASHHPLFKQGGKTMDDIMLFVLGLIMGLTISLLFITYSEYRVERERLRQRQEKETEEFMKSQLMDRLFKKRDEGDDYA